MDEGNEAQESRRERFLHEAAKIPGIYVPSLYEVSYHDDGTVAEISQKWFGRNISILGAAE